MSIFYYFFAFSFGAVIGSFLNVVILRYNTGESVVAGGSKCLACAKKLKWYELIPVFSFLAQKGRCRKCFSKISWQYPIIEITTGLLFLFFFSAQGATPVGGQGLAMGWQFSFYFIFSLFYFLTIFSLLTIIAVYDYYHQIIPDKFVYSFIGLSFFGLLFEVLDLGFIWNLEFGIWNFMSGIILFSFFGALWLLSKGTWMGFGDAKLALGIGWMLGLTNGVAAVILAFWLGAIVGVFLLLWSKCKNEGNYGMKTRIAFGPFLVLGTIIAFFAGGTLIKIFIHNLAP